MEREQHGGRLRVVQAGKLYPPEIGGIENVTCQLAEGLAGDTDMTVVCCNSRLVTVRESRNGVDIIRCAATPRVLSAPLSISYIAEVIKQSRRCDVLHLHYPYPLADLALLLSGFKGRVVVHFHSDIMKQRLTYRLIKPLIRHTMRRSDAIIAATKGNVAGSPLLREFAAKCHIIPYGTTPLHAPVLNVLDGFCRSAGSVKVLFIGRLVYYKGVEVLLEAFRLLSQEEDGGGSTQFCGTEQAAEERTDAAENVGVGVDSKAVKKQIGASCELFVIGSGPTEERLRAAAHEDSGLRESVHFCGRLSSAATASAVEECDFLVLPSNSRAEAFGLVQLEAMAAGKPVINTSIATGVPWVSLDGVTGLTVPPNDPRALAEAIRRLAEDAPLRLKLGANALHRVRNEFSEAGMLSAVLSLWYGEK